MGKKVRLLSLTGVAMAMAGVTISLTAGAQVNSLGAPAAKVGAPGVAPLVPPAMPQAVAPQAAAPISFATSAFKENEGRQPNNLRLISEKRSELELLKLQAEIDKFKKPTEDFAKKDDSSNLQMALEQAKKEHAAPAAAPVEQAPPVLLLATFGAPDLPSMGYAEFKVGDLLVHAKVGDRLPSGHYLMAVRFDSVEISKSKKAKKGQVVYISASDTASVYGSRAKSGSAVDAAAPAAAAVGFTTAAPNGLPPMPGMSR